MKKIILAFDGTNFSEGAFEFARNLNLLQPILLTGVFLAQTHFSNLWSYASGTGIPLIEEVDSDLIKKNIQRFKQLCQSNSIEHIVHEDFYNFAIAELKNESKFADLLILGSEIFYKGITTEDINIYLQDALFDVYCPVLLVPEKFNFPESIILAYDGSNSSIYAIKQFVYLFPELCNKETLLVFADSDIEKNIPEKKLIEELVSRHFNNLSFLKLHVNPQKYFNLWISGQTSPVLISGSFARSSISLLLKKSFVKQIIADHKIPVFIAHT